MLKCVKSIGLALVTLAFVMGAALPVRADDPELRLEFSQQGDPEHPRALILIHGVQGPGDLGPNNHDSWKSFLDSWGDEKHNWALRQYCSVYTFNYEGKFATMEQADTLASQLSGLVSQDAWVTLSEKGLLVSKDAWDGDGLDSRQPRPTFKGASITLVGHSNGGLVAREFAAQSAGTYQIERIVYIGSPQDGCLASTLAYFIMSSPDIFPDFGGLQQATLLLMRKKIKSIGQGWRWMVRDEIRNPTKELRARYQHVYALPTYFAFGTQAVTDLVLTGNTSYGSGYRIHTEVIDHDGIVDKNSAQAKKTNWPYAPPKGTKEIRDKGTTFGNHGGLNGDARFFHWLTFTYGGRSDSQVDSEATGTSAVLDSRTDDGTKLVLDDYLDRRAEIEGLYYDYVARDPLGDAPDLASVTTSPNPYWDPRKLDFLPGFLEGPTLYYYMWVVTPKSLTVKILGDHKRKEYVRDRYLAISGKKLSDLSTDDDLLIEQVAINPGIKMSEARIDEAIRQKLPPATPPVVPEN